MSEGREHPFMAKGSTRTDLRLTRSPANTPRSRLHNLAALGVRVGQEAKRITKLSREDMDRLRAIGRRGVELLKHDSSLRARLIVHICYGLDRVIASLTLLDSVDIVHICEGLSMSLIQLEVAENSLKEQTQELVQMQRDLKIERGFNAQLRASLAAEQVRAAAAIRDIPEERWDEPTRNSGLTDAQMRALSARDIDS